MLLILFGACNPNNDLQFPSYVDYFPLRIGDYRIYQVDETRIQPFNLETTFVYEIKTLVTDSFPNSEGGISYIIHRFKRDDSLEDWTSLDSWVARVNEREVVITESSIPYVKISFPVQTNKSWNGNVYNNEESFESCIGATNSCDLYSFGFIQSPHSNSGGLSFMNAIEVIENNDPDEFIRQDIRKSIYAFDLGLVYREINILNYCTSGECYGKKLVEDGQIISMELIEYGRE